MKILPTPLLWLVAITAVAFITTLCTPQTGWMVRRDIRSIAAPDPSVKGFLDQGKVTAIAAEHPNDYQLQLLTAVNLAPAGSESDVNSEITQFDFVESKFPRTASLFAIAIESECQHNYSVEPSESEQRYYQPNGPPFNYISVRPLDQQRLRILNDIVREGKIGEAIDRDNAFFPAMLATACFALDEYPQGQTAMQQAGRDKQWNEYTDDLVQCKARYWTIVDGGVNGFRLIGYSAVYQEIYGLVRHAAQMSVWLASEDDKSGNFADALATRESVMHLGSLMRSTAKTMIGNLEGNAVVSAVWQLPTVKVNRLLPAPEKWHDRNKRQKSAAIQYFLARNRPQDAAFLTQELSIEDALRSGGRDNVAESVLIGMEIDMALVELSWCILLLSAVGFLIVGASATVAWLGRLQSVDGTSRRRWIQSVAGTGAATLIAWTVYNAVQHSELAVDLYWFVVPAKVAEQMSYHQLGNAIVEILALPVILFLAALAVVAKVKRRSIIEFVIRNTILILTPLSCVTLVVYCGFVIHTTNLDKTIKTQMEAQLRVGEWQLYAQKTGKPWPGMPKTS
jgi:hypothetical protein